MIKTYWRFLIFLIIGVLLFTWAASRHRQNPADFQEPEIKLFLHEKNEVISLSLEDYIRGTVAAEMPASFDMEALKAQAVCARTYALKKLIDKHPYPQGADLSDDIAVCQAFCNTKGNASGLSQENLDKIDQAIHETRGEVLLYDSAPIDAVYHSCCGGRTDSGWGGINRVPYLRSVSCSTCKNSRHYCESFTFNNDRLAKLVGDHGAGLEIKILSSSPAGRANQLSINGKKIYASRVREALDLPSQWISFEVGREQTVITTRGYGHGIGLCQYGANGLAQQGKNYRQILQKYYHGTVLYKLPY